MLSIISIRNLPRYRNCFERRVKEGKDKMNILVAVGRKIFSVSYAILKTGVPITQLGMRIAISLWQGIYNRCSYQNDVLSNRLRNR